MTNLEFLLSQVTAQDVAKRTVHYGSLDRMGCRPWVTSDGTWFVEFKAAVRHEVLWLQEDKDAVAK